METVIIAQSTITVTVLIVGMAFLVQVVILRWIFRVNEQIDLLTEIRDRLEKPDTGLLNSE